MLHQIGSGVLGPVFRTYEPQRDRLVAIKAFRLDIVPEDVARLADALRRLTVSSPNQPTIVAAVDAGLEGTIAYLAMEYVAAETLDVALRHLAPTPLERALPILSQIAEALEAGWAAGIGHGALHPRDVFIMPGTNEVRVTGFGVVPALDSIGIKPPVRRPYTAPERAAGEAWDIRADVYSLGALAHELLTRRRPAGPGEQDGALAASTAPEQRVMIRRVLSAALAERPDHRFASPRAFVAALQAVAGGEPVDVLPGVPAGEPVAEAGAPLGEPGAPLAEVALPLALAEPEHQAPDIPAPLVVRLQASAPQPSAEYRVESAGIGLASKPVDPWAEQAKSRPLASQTPPGQSGDEAPSPPTAPVWVPASPRTDVPVADPPAFPWVAVGAVAVACTVLGTAMGYRIGLGRPHPVIAPASPSAIALPSGSPVARPADTEVAVPPEPVPPPDTVTSQPGRAATPSPVAVVPTSGKLLVRSVPSGAAVVIDGRSHGQTPATLRDLAFGAHTVQVSHPGYLSRSEKVTLSADQPARNLTVDLEPAKSSGVAATSANGPTRISGSMYVDSRPRGARVLLDGHLLGTTPLTIPEVATGAHALRLELVGHKPLTKSVSVKSGEPTRVEVTLEEGLKEAVKDGRPDHLIARRRGH